MPKSEALVPDEQGIYWSIPVDAALELIDEEAIGECGLDQPEWAVIDAYSICYDNLTYAEAVAYVEDMKDKPTWKGSSGLTIVTNQAARNMPVLES